MMSTRHSVFFSPERTQTTHQSEVCLNKPAILALADGSIFHGQALGCEGQTVGEVVFNTAMTGYQESLTDPASAQQLLAFTYPHIGNSGTNADDAESERVWAAGMIIRDLPLLASSWRDEQSLSDYLAAQQVVAIAGIDTRRLTRILREKGNLGGCIVSGAQATEARALELAQGYAGLQGQALIASVSTQQPYTWTQASWQLASNTCPEVDTTQLKQHVVVYDFGVRRSLLRALVSQGCRVTVVPANTAVHEVLALQPQGVVLSGGPGDPTACSEAINTVRALLSTSVPVFATGLGFQLLALASGAQTHKLTCGQYGANQPVQDVASKQCMITQQNHSFAVTTDSLPAELRLTHVSLFDQSAQGLQRTDTPAFGFQGVPELSAEPNTSAVFFDRFITAMKSEGNNPSC